MRESEVKALGFVYVADDLYQYVDLINHIYGPMINYKELLIMSTTQAQDYIKAIRGRKPISKTLTKPEPLSGVHFTNVINMCKDYIADLDAGGGDDPDFEHYLYEEVLKAIYGDKIFDWINKKI